MLFVVFAASLALRWSLLGERWINPDEGAHLMDAALVLQGLVPAVDFGTRQPLYVYALAGVLELLGPGLTVGRLLPLASSLLTGLAIYFLGTELVDRRVGLVASAVYLLLPLEILQSVMVKTEAPVTLLVVLAVYAAVAGQRRGHASLFVVSGVLAGLGYYVRETALLVALVVTVFLVLSEAGRWRSVTRSLGLFVAGYAVVVLLALVHYARFLSPGELFAFTPVAFLAVTLRRFGSLVLPGGSSSGTAPEVAAERMQVAPPTTETWEGYGEPVELYLAYLEDAFLLHAFLFVGMALATVTLLLKRGETVPRDLLRRDRTALAAGYAWLVALGVMYVYRYMTRGFFIDYFREFLPPLVLLLALWLCRAVPALRADRNVLKLVVLALPVGAAWFLLQARLPDHFGLGHHATLATAILAVGMVALSNRSGASRWWFAGLLAAAAVWVVGSRRLGPSLFSGVGASAATMAALFVIMAGWYRIGREHVVGKTVQFAAFSLAAAAFALGLSYSALRLHIAYEAVWPPAEAERISTVVAQSTAAGAEVLSGAVIWEFMADRRPFQLISHPLTLKKQAPTSYRARLRSALVENPPEVVVMDGYTEATYGRNVPFLDSLVEHSYVEIATSREGYRPVSVLRRVAPDRADSASRVDR